MRLRILHVGKFYPPHRGGMETHLETLCEGLKDSVDLKVLVSNHEDRYVHEDCNGVSVERLAQVCSIASSPICRSLIRKLRENEADIIQIHVPHPVAILAYLISGHRGKLVITYHSDIIRQQVLSRLFQPVFDLALRRCSAIIATSPDYINHSPVLSRFRSKCHVIPLGLPVRAFALKDTSEVERIRKQYGPNLILAVGRYVYYKGFQYLIDCMHTVPGKLVLIGDGPLRQDLSMQVERAGLGDKVFFAGEVPDAAPYYHAADVFVLPSIARSEAFGIVQTEAMACGKPVVNTMLASGVPYVSLHGVTGLSVPPRDSQALASALQTLLSNPDLRTQYGEAGRRRVEEEFTQEVMVARTLALYRSICTN